MSRDHAQWLVHQVRAHAARYFTPEANRALETAQLDLVTWSDAGRLRGPRIGLPIDVEAPAAPLGIFHAPFGGTQLTLWNPLPSPGADWLPYPGSGPPLWHRHPSGALVPAWNVVATLVDLLTLREERGPRARDKLGRFIGMMSPRTTAGVLEVPIFNNAVATLVDACLGLGDGRAPRLTAAGIVRPPLLLLSHDNDQLRGNDLWTQGIRLLRIVQPVLHRKRPRLINAWWAARNVVRPHDYYFDNIEGMVEVERMLGYRSAFYFLNGTGGRYGARSGPALIPSALTKIPPGWEIGMHYNFDTLLDEHAFSAQREELQRLALRPIEIGRAHYIRFDPDRSFAFLQRMGVHADESLGYPDFLGYRAGIAGAFRPFGPPNTTMPLELPLTVMDGTLLAQYPLDPTAAFRRLLAHIGEVGGALTLLFHPGTFFNLEQLAAVGLYRMLLETAKQLGARGDSIGALLHG